MNSRFHSRIRSGLIALGVFAGLCAPAAAMPLAGGIRTAVSPAVAAAPADVLTVSHRRYRCYDGYCGNRYRNDRYWNDDRRYRKHRRHYRGGLYVQPRLYLGVPTYRYVQPRRYYGYRLSAAHVAWCYNRYISYREWDNTFQPYHGPRRQCWSPYS